MKILKMSIFLMMAVIVTAGAVLAAPARIASITDHIDGPMRVAVDSQGNLYVTEPAKKRVVIFDNKHQYLRSLSVPYPVGIAVDPAGKIYVGSGASDRKSGNKNAVYIYNADLTLSGSLGIGEGEVAYPNDIAIGSDGNIYVVDTGNHRIKVYDPVTGAQQFSFGVFGSASGQFKRPVGVAVNDTAGEIYVADHPVVSTSSGPTDGARIQVFNKNGQFLRSFGQYGTNIGQITAPIGIAVDGAGLLYVTDSYQNVVHILSPTDGTPVGPGGLYDPAKRMSNPMGVVVTKNNLVYAASYSGEGGKGRIDVFALDGHVTMAVDPLSLAFIGTQYAGNPDPQTIVIANTGDGTLNWSATADQAWINLGKQDAVGPKSAGGLAVGVNISAFGVGTYTGTITIDSGFGQTQAVGVTLSVVQPPILNISNGWLNFASKKGTAPAAQGITLGVNNLTGPVTWGLVSDSPSWLTVSPASGTISSTAPSATASVSINTTGLKVGSYSGLLTVSAPGAIGSGSKVTVNLAITPSTKIKVNTNRSDAKFSLSGPAAYTGSGSAWSVEDVPAGDYTVTFDAVAGYKKPRPQSKALAADGEVSFNGNYVSWQELAAKRNIVVAKGPGASNDSRIGMFKNNGTPVDFDLIAMATMSGASVAVGDVDGDGAADLIVGAGSGQNNPATVRVFRVADKSLFAEFVPFGSLNGARVAAGDLDGDGMAEVLVSDNMGSIAVYTYANGKMASTGITLSGFAAAVADMASDGKPRVVTLDKNGLNIWNVDLATGAASLMVNKKNLRGTSVAAGDIDGDGKDEILIAGSLKEKGNAPIYVLEANGKRERLLFLKRSSATVAAADIDGDGIAEIIIGTTDESKAHGRAHNDKRRATVKVFGADGVMKFQFNAFPEAADVDEKEGINVAVGDLGL